MPSMDWETFQDAHYRPHLVIANLGGPAKPGHGETRKTMLERLATSLGVAGNYAIKRDGAAIHAAFELDMDAARFADVLLAKTTFRDPEWASTAVARMDRAAQRKITDALRQYHVKNAKKR